jgi:circadian clock protein KaiC
MNIPARISTGIAGLDNVLMGGLMKAGFYLIQGDPGAGKTTMALQYSIARVAEKQKVLYVSLTETHEDLKNAAASHHWKLDGIHICDLSRSAGNLAGQPEVSVFHPSETELGETTQAIISEVDKAKPDHVIFDGLSELRLLAGDPLRYRRQLLSLKGYFSDRGAGAGVGPGLTSNCIDTA